MTCTKFNTATATVGDTKVVGNVTYQYKGNEIWEAITAPLSHDQLSNRNAVGAHDAGSIQLEQGMTLQQNFDNRDVVSLTSSAFYIAGLPSKCMIQKLRTDYPEFAVYTPLSTDGKEWHRWLFTNRFNIGATGATRMIGCTLAGLYPSTAVAKTSANNVSEATGTAATVTKSSADGVKVGTWTTPATVLTTTDVSYSTTIGDTCTYTITGVNRFSLRGLVAGNGGIAKVTIKESGVEIPESNYSLPTNHLVNFLAGATATTTYHYPLAHGLDTSKTYTVEVKVDTTNTGGRVYTAGLLGYPTIAYNAVGIHGVVTDASLASQTNALSLAPFTTSVYQLVDTTRVDWRYVQTTSGSEIVLTVYNSTGSIVATKTLDTYASGSTAKSVIVANNLPKGTYYLHVQNGKTKNAASSGYRYYDFGAMAYDETQAGEVGVDAFDNKDMPLIDQDPNNGTEYMMIGSGNLELAVGVRKVGTVSGTDEFVGGIHGYETAPTLTVKADGVTIGYASLAQYATVVASDFEITFDTSLLLPEDSSPFMDVTYTLGFSRCGYSVKTDKTVTSPDAIITEDFTIMLNCPSTQAGNQATKVGGGFELVAADKNYQINNYDNGGTFINNRQDSVAFVNRELLALCHYTVQPIIDTALKTSPYVTDNDWSLIQDRTDRTIKFYTRAWSGNTTDGINVPAGTSWSHSKIYRCATGNFKALVGM